MFLGLDNGLARRQAIIWTNADLIHWRIYAALGGELIKRARLSLIIMMMMMMMMVMNNDDDNGNENKSNNNSLYCRLL